MKKDTNKKVITLKTKWNNATPKRDELDILQTKMRECMENYLETIRAQTAEHNAQNRIPTTRKNPTSLTLMLPPSDPTDDPTTEKTPSTSLTNNHQAA